MKTYKLTAKTTANGIRYTAMLYTDGKFDRTIKFGGGTEYKETLKSIEAEGYKEEVSDIVRMFREVSDGGSNGNLTEAQEKMIKTLTMEAKRRY